MKVRQATPADYPAMQRFGERFHAWLKYDDIPYDADSVLWWFDLMQREGVCLVIEDDDGQLVGMAGGIFSPFVFNLRYRVGAEIMWWVQEDHRNGGTGKMLLAELERHAELAGCKRWSMIAIEGTQDSVGAIYERNGYNPTERTYSKVIRPCHTPTPQPSANTHENGRDDSVS